LKSLSLVLVTLLGTVGIVQAQNWCASPMPQPPKGIKVGGAIGSEIGPGKGNGTTDPPCPPALCMPMKTLLPADADIKETHFCAGEMGAGLNECVATGNPTWWDCRDNPPYARFSDYVVGSEGGKKFAQVTFKMWSDNYKKARFVVLYTSASKATGLTKVKVPKVPAER